MGKKEQGSAHLATQPAPSRKDGVGSLVLCLERGQRIRVGPDCWISLVDTGRTWAKLHFRAPRSVEIHREAVAHRVDRERARASREESCPG